MSQAGALEPSSIGASNMKSVHLRCGTLLLWAVRIVGARGKTTWNLDFDVKLPARDAAAGMSCSK